MVVTWTPVPPTAPTLDNLSFALWAFRDAGGPSQQGNDALDDAQVTARLERTALTIGSVKYYQPLKALADYIRTDPEQRKQSKVGGVSDTWVDPYDRAAALEAEQQLWNTSAIPGFSIPVVTPILTPWELA